LSIEAFSFPVGKGFFETLDDFIYIRPYGFQGKPSLLPFMSLTNYLQLKFTSNTNFGNIYSTRRGRSNSFHYLGEL
jgi:hypothetical protein